MSIEVEPDIAKYLPYNITIIEKHYDDDTRWSIVYKDHNTDKFMRIVKKDNCVYKYGFKVDEHTVTSLE